MFSKAPFFGSAKNSNELNRLKSISQRAGYPLFKRLPGSLFTIQTRCRDLYIKQFCLYDIAPTILIILITHIIIAIRWMLIKILSVVINHHVEYTVIVVVGLGVL